MNEIFFIRSKPRLKPFKEIRATNQIIFRKSKHRFKTFYWDRNHESNLFYEIGTSNKTFKKIGTTKQFIF